MVEVLNSSLANFLLNGGRAIADSFRQEKLLINLLDKATFPQPYAEGNCLVVICRRVYRYDFFSTTHVNQAVDGMEL